MFVWPGEGGREEIAVLLRVGSSKGARTHPPGSPISLSSPWEG